MTISSQEIEIERLKSTCVALNAKVMVLEDHKKDVENHSANFDNGELKRGELHAHIVKTGEDVVRDNRNHTSIQEDLKQ